MTSEDHLTNNKRPIPRTHRLAMGCHLWVYWRTNYHVIRWLTVLPTWIVPVLITPWCCMAPRYTVTNKEIGPDYYGGMYYSDRSNQAHPSQTHLKLKITKYCLPITPFAFVKSFWNCAESTKVIPACAAQNAKRFYDWNRCFDPQNCAGFELMDPILQHFWMAWVAVTPENIRVTLCITKNSKICTGLR